jgi:F-type H+-transporting ATPase subunit b
MTRPWLITFLLLGVLFVPCAAASAAEGHGEGQVNIFDPADIPLGFWTIVVFVVLLVVLKKYAWGPILEGLQKREQNIAAAIEEAEKARAEAERLREQFQAEMARAQEKVREILDEGRRDSQRVAEEMIAKARAEIQAERDRLRREIESARDQALQELWNQAAQLATLISAKAIRRQLSPEDHRRLVDEALAELERANVMQHR